MSWLSSTRLAAGELFAPPPTLPPVCVGHRRSWTRPDAYGDPHASPVERHVVQEVGNRSGAEHASQHDGLPQLDLAVVEQVLGAQLGQPFQVTGPQPGHDLLVELDTD